MVGEAPVLQPQYSIRHVYDSPVVGDDDDAAILLLGQVAKKQHDLMTALRVEVRCRLVRKNKRRVVGDRPRYGHALSFSAREIARLEVQSVA